VCVYLDNASQNDSAMSKRASSATDGGGGGGNKKDRDTRDKSQPKLQQGPSRSEQAQEHEARASTNVPRYDARVDAEPDADVHAYVDVDADAETDTIGEGETDLGATTTDAELEVTLGDLNIGGAEAEGAAGGAHAGRASRSTRTTIEDLDLYGSDATHLSAAQIQMQQHQQQRQQQPQQRQPVIPTRRSLSVTQPVQSPVTMSASSSLYPSLGGMSTGLAGTAAGRPETLVVRFAETGSTTSSIKTSSTANAYPSNTQQPGGDLDDGASQGLDMHVSGYSQKYFKKARRPAHRRRVLGASTSRGEFAARSAQLAGMMGSSFRSGGESSDDEEEEGDFEPEWRFRVSASCTCDTYLLSGVYGALRDKNTIARLLLSTTSSALVAQRQQQGMKRTQTKSVTSTTSSIAPASGVAAQITSTGLNTGNTSTTPTTQSKSLTTTAADASQTQGDAQSIDSADPHGLYFIDTDSITIGAPQPYVPAMPEGSTGTQNPLTSTGSIAASQTSATTQAFPALPSKAGRLSMVATDPNAPPLPAKASFMYYGSDVLHMKLRTGNDVLMQKHLFVFEYGCLAFFNFTEEEEEFIKSILEPYQEDTLPESERAVGMEDMTYVYGPVSAVSNDTITLSSFSSLEKLSVAFAMAQCVKLNVFEERIDEEIEKNRELPESLAAKGSIGLTRNEMAKKVGKLFIERNNINLHADILDDPEFFWEQDRYKHVYERLFKYLELGKRVSLLNKRLGIMKELFDMIADQLDNLHAEKLEYIVIYLIVIEVVVAVGWNILVKDILGFFHHSE